MLSFLYTTHKGTPYTIKMLSFLYTTHKGTPYTFPVDISMHDFSNIRVPSSCIPYFQRDIAPLPTDSRKCKFCPNLVSHPIWRINWLIYRRTSTQEYDFNSLWPAFPPCSSINSNVPSQSSCLMQTKLRIRLRTSSDTAHLRMFRLKWVVQSVRNLRRWSYGPRLWIEQEGRWKSIFKGRDFASSSRYSPIPKKCAGWMDVMMLTSIINLLLGHRVGQPPSSRYYLHNHQYGYHEYVSNGESSPCHPWAPHRSPSELEDGQMQFVLWGRHGNRWYLERNFSLYRRSLSKLAYLCYYQGLLLLLRTRNNQLHV